MLYLSKHSDIKGLELMSAFRGECKDEDVVIVCNCLELVSFMRVVAIKEEEDGVIVHLVCGGKWDKGLFEPFKTKFVVCPAIG